MKYMKNKLLSPLLFIFFFGCNMSDVITDLGNGYYYSREGSESNYLFLGQKKGASSYLIEETVIQPNVKKVVFDENFIIVIQSPNYSLFRYNILNEHDLTPYLSDDDRILKNHIGDSLLRYNYKYQKILENKVNYYFINKSSGKLTGPMQKYEVEEIATKLEIPQELVIQILNFSKEISL